MRLSLFKFSLVLSSLIVVNCSSAVAADFYEYQTFCNPTASNHLARAIQGKLYLALRSDPTVQKFSVSAKITKVKNLPTKTQSEDELVAGLGLTFNPTDLSLSVGGKATGHACYVDGLLSINITRTSKTGATASNQFSTVIKVPGAYVTTTKVRVSK